MYFRLVTFLGLLAALPALPSLAAQPATAGGKSDLQHIPAMAVGDAGLRDGLPDLAGLTIEPAFAPAGVGDFIAYNLERLDASERGPYGIDRFGSQVASIPWDIAGAFAAVS